MAGTNGPGEERSKRTQALKEKDMEVQVQGTVQTCLWILRLVNGRQIKVIPQT